MPENSEKKTLQTNDLSRREFVVTVGTVTGGFALGLPLVGERADASQAATTALPEQTTAAATVAVNLTINGQKHDLMLDPRVTLLDLLREDLHLTGTKKGCDHGQCGACTVLANGVRINSCLSLAVVHHGHEITTIEGLSHGEALHPLQTAFVAHDGLQCGYCTPGQICSAVGLLSEWREGFPSFVTDNLRSVGPVKLTPDEIRERMSGNICRCGAYPGIVAAVQTVAEHSPERHSGIGNEGGHL